MIRTIVLTASLLFIVVGNTTGALAAGPVPSPNPDAKCQETTEWQGQQIQIWVKCPNKGDFSGRDKVENTSKSRTVSHGPRLRYSVKYYSECTPYMSSRGACDSISESTCPGGGWRTYRVITAVNGPRAGQIVGVSAYCSIEPAMEVPGAEQDIARVSLSEFRKLPITASVIVSQPDQFSLRNGHAHIYAESKSQNFSIVLLDQRVRVRAIPVSYAWTYGDGTSRRLSFPGEPVSKRGFDEPTTTSHVYKETGDFNVGLSTSFRGEYSTEGGPWTPVPGVASIPSESIIMSVWRTKKILVAENCNQNNDAPGCKSVFQE